MDLNIAFTCPLRAAAGGVHLPTNSGFNRTASRLTRSRCAMASRFRK